MNTTNLRAFRTSPWGDLGLFYTTLQDGKRFTAQMAKHVELVEWEASAAHPPLVSLSTHEAQQLMDSLWDCGLRPSEGTGSAGSLAATHAHLKDMRTLVAKQLGVEFK